MDSSSLIVGLGGAVRGACAAVWSGDRFLGVCEQERITRARAAGFNRSGLPDEALDELLRRRCRRREEVSTFVLAEEANLLSGLHAIRLDHHFAHACAAFLPSPFEGSTVIVCDDEPPYVSVWAGRNRHIAPIEWAWSGPGFANVYSACADAFGFSCGGHEQRLEALARREPGARDSDVDALFGAAADHLELAPFWRTHLDGRVAAALDDHMRASIASAVQARIADLLVEFVEQVKRRTPERDALCLGGQLFENSHFNSTVRLSEIFPRTFVPVNSGNGGLAVGGALHAAGPARSEVTPFLGPSYTPEEIKATLDNCKVSYQWASADERIAIAVRALRRGHLVAWMEGPMEWGPRALGARSIVADPFSPYVLENLNQFLKQRESWRGYALSGLPEAVATHFVGPDASTFMECDYVPCEPARFRHVLPGPRAAVRVHTVGDEAPDGFRRLLGVFGEATGVPILVNTSFNGFREPIVCSPRDAIRVFFGTGIDLLIIGEFIVAK